MDVVQRLAERLLASRVPLDRESLAPLADRLLAEEGPLAEAGDSRRAADHIVGLGPLEDLLRDPLVSDVLVNGTGEVWIERDGGLELTDVCFVSPDAVRAAVDRVIAPLGLSLDAASPAVDARLPDGSRLHAALPPLSVDGPVVAVRRFIAAVSDLEALVAVGGISEAGAALLADTVRLRSNLLVAGATGSGKTTLLNVLVSEIPPSGRVVTVEDAGEVQLSGHMVRLEARPPNSEGKGEVSLGTLVRHALRLRPDRLLIGEVRGAEALDMILAMSTGHTGSMSTVHAGTAEEALWRVETLALGDRRSSGELAVRRQLRAALDVVVLMQRGPSGRRVGAMYRLVGDSLDEIYRCP